MAGVTRQAEEGVTTTNTPEGSLSVNLPAVAIRPFIRPRSTPAHEGFEHANGDPHNLSWWEGGPCPALVNWLNAAAPAVIRPGARTAVSCCGIGDDAAALFDRGYDVIAFDNAPDAIAWAQQRHPRAAACFQTRDLFDPPCNWLGRFDFVVDVNAICHAPDPTAHAAALRSLMTTRGVLLVICHAAEAGECSPSAPGPVAPTELSRWMEGAGLTPIGTLDAFEDADALGRPVRRLRGLYQRSGTPSARGVDCQ